MPRAATKRAAKKKAPARKPPRHETILETHFDKEGFCKFLGIDQRTADRWQASRYGPPRSKIGTKVFYDKQVVMAWIKSREQGGKAA